MAESYTDVKIHNLGLKTSHPFSSNITLLWPTLSLLFLQLSSPCWVKTWSMYDCRERLKNFSIKGFSSQLYKLQRHRYLQSKINTRLNYSCGPLLHVGFLIPKSTTFPFHRFCWVVSSSSQLSLSWSRISQFPCFPWKKRR